MGKKKKRRHNSARATRVDKSGGENPKTNSGKFYIITTIISIAISLLSLIVMGAIAWNANLLQESNYALGRVNQNLVLYEIPHMEYIEDGKYEVTLTVQQGSISEAVLVNFFNEEITYAQKTRNVAAGGRLSFEIGTREIDSRNIRAQDSLSAPSIGLEGIVTLRNIAEFALVLQDTRNEWHVFYFLIRPPIYFDDNANLIYGFEMFDPENNESLGYVKHDGPLAQYSEQVLIINSRLINYASIANKVRDFPSENEFAIFEEGWEMQADDGTKVSGNPKFTIPYTVSYPGLILNRMHQIWADINQFQ